MPATLGHERSKQKQDHSIPPTTSPPPWPYPLHLAGYRSPSSPATHGLSWPPRSPGAPCGATPTWSRRCGVGCGTISPAPPAGGVTDQLGPAGDPQGCREIIARNVHVAKPGAGQGTHSECFARGKRRGNGDRLDRRGLTGTHQVLRGLPSRRSQVKSGASCAGAGRGWRPRPRPA